MPKLSPEKANERREEIIAACSIILVIGVFSLEDSRG